jgi:hypothetical protein
MQNKKEAIMPKGNRRGPENAGPITGRAAGYCAGFNTPGFRNTVPGQGFRAGFGRGRGAGGGGGCGRGWRNMFFATGQPGWMRFGGNAAQLPNNDPETEKQVLKTQADHLQSELTSIQQRLEEIDKKPANQ